MKKEIEILNGFDIYNIKDNILELVPYIRYTKIPPNIMDDSCGITLCLAAIPTIMCSVAYLIKAGVWARIKANGVESAMAFLPIVVFGFLFIFVLLFARLISLYNWICSKRTQLHIKEKVLKAYTLDEILDVVFILLDPNISYDSARNKTECNYHFLLRLRENIENYKLLTQNKILSVKGKSTITFDLRMPDNSMRRVVIEPNIERTYTKSIRLIFTNWTDPVLYRPYKKKEKE